MAPIRHGQELLQGLEHRHLAAEPAPNAAELESDDAGADDAEARGHRVELQGIPGIDDVLAVVRHGFLSRMGTDPEARTTCLASSVFSAAVRAVHQHLVAGQQSPMPLDADDAVGLEQRGDAAGHGLDDGGAALLHGAQDRA